MGSKGLGLLYVAPGAPAPRPAVVSHGYGAGFASEFVWDGCRDYAGALALPALLEWWAAVGGHAAGRDYCARTLAAAVAALTSRWRTRAHAPPALYSHMACVELPPAALPPGAAPAGAAADAPCAATSAHAKAVQDALFARGVEAPVKCLPATGVAGGGNMRLYVRISAAVYNEAADYDKLADAVDALRWEADGAAAGGSGEPSPSAP